jgi:hypothetical protein
MGGGGVPVTRPRSDSIPGPHPRSVRGALPRLGKDLYDEEFRVLRFSVSPRTGDDLLGLNF